MLEIYSPQLVSDGVIERLNDRARTHCIVLHGPVKNEGVVGDITAGIYDHALGGISFVLQENIRMKTIAEFVLKLDIPEHIKKLGLKPNRLEESLNRFRSLAFKKPFAALIIGKYTSGDDVAILTFVNGMTPENALREIQKRTRLKIS